MVRWLQNRIRKSAEDEWNGLDYELLWFRITYFNLVTFDHDNDSPVYLLQGMESVAVETVNAGMDGTEMHVKSGSAQNILNNPWQRTGFLFF